MRPLSQVDPWNGCRVCRTLAERGILPNHNWTHELRMWWSSRVPAWTRGSKPGREIPETYEGRGLAGGALYSLAGALVASMAREGLLDAKSLQQAVKEATDAR